MQPLMPHKIEDSPQKPMLSSTWEIETLFAAFRLLTPSSASWILMVFGFVIFVHFPTCSVRSGFDIVDSSVPVAFCAAGRQSHFEWQWSPKCFFCFCIAESGADEALWGTSIPGSGKLFPLLNLFSTFILLFYFLSFRFIFFLFWFLLLFPFCLSRLCVLSGICGRLPGRNWNGSLKFRVLRYLSGQPVGMRSGVMVGQR